MSSVKKDSRKEGDSEHLQDHCSPLLRISEGTVVSFSRSELPLVLTSHGKLQDWKDRLSVRSKR